RTVVLGVVAPVFRREGHDPEVDHFEYLTATHVDESEQSFERTCVAIVVFRLPQVGQAAGDSPSLFMAETERAGRPGVDLHQGTVDDAAPVECGIPLELA